MNWKMYSYSQLEKVLDDLVHSLSVLEGVAHTEALKQISEVASEMALRLEVITCKS